jgi:hypothetical protein
MKKNTADKALLAEAVGVASTTTVLPSDAEKAALTTPAATTTMTTPAEDKAEKPLSTDPPNPPPASNNCPAIGVKSPKAQYLPSSAKALAEVAAGNQQSGTGSGPEEVEESDLSFFC